MKFSLLTEEDVYGENCLSIFKKVSPIAKVTDVVKQATVKDSEKLNSEYVGIRLKVSVEDIKKEIIKDTFNGVFHVDGEENGVKILLALEWPQDFAIDEDKRNIDLLNQYGKLKSAKRYFEVLPNEYEEAIYYKEYKYVNINENWVKVQPIQWYYAEEEQLLVSKKILFNYSIFNEEKFLKYAIMNSVEKGLYVFSISLSYEDYKEELEEIIFWKTFLEKRNKRKENLEKIKELLGAEKIEELPNIIDEVLILNEEDEKYLKKYVIPYYCQK